MLRRIVDPIRRYGIVAGSVYLLDRAACLLGLPIGVAQHYLMVQPVAREPRLRAGRATPIEPIGPGHEALAALDAPEEVARFRFEQGAVCLGITRDRDPIGLIWLAFDGFNEDAFRLRIELQPKGLCAWDLGLYIDPSHRGGLAFARLWDAADALMRDRGVRWTFSRVSSTNNVSMAAHKRLGARRIGAILVARIARAQVLLCSVPPYVHLSLGPRAVPTVHLRAPADP